AGMHEEAQPVVVAERQRGEPGEGLVRYPAVPVVAQRAGAAVRQPQRHGAIAGVRVDRHLLVVAAQADDGAGPRRLPLSWELEHVPAVRPAIDIVADEDVARRATGGAGLARRDQPVELVEAAVDIADRESQG